MQKTFDSDSTYGTLSDAPNENQVDISDTHTPFQSLSPDAVVNAIESIGVETDLCVNALNSFENRVYQVGIENSAPMVAKFYRPHRWSDEQIMEEHRFCLDLSENEIPAIGPKVIDGKTLFSFESAQQRFRFCLFERKGGHPPELEDEDTLNTIGQQIGRIHAFGAIRDFEHRPGFDPMVLGVESCEFLVDEGFIPPELEESYIAVSSQLLEWILEKFASTPHKSIRLHGDCHPGNILQRQDSLYFVDFDDARFGPAIQDLWMCLSGERQQQLRQLEVIVDGYRQFHDFDPRELGLIEPLRALRQIHYAAWIARRWNDPAFPLAFPWFNTQTYWAKHVLDLKEQLAKTFEAPLFLDQ